jgi:membrane protein
MASRLSSRGPLVSRWRLDRATLWHFTKGVARNIDENDLFGRASGLAFNFVLALFPLLLFFLTIFALFASRSAELQTNLLKYIADFLPPAAAHLVTEIAGELGENASGGKLTFDIALTLWFASGGVSSMISSLNLSLRVPETRSWLKIRTIALGLTLVISVLLLSALFLVLAGEYVMAWIGAKLGLGAITVLLGSAAQWPAAMLFVILSFSLIYSYGPSPQGHRWYWVTPGSIFGVFLWLLASLGFRGYLRFFNTYEATYGSLGAAMILLVWLYVTGLTFLIGAEINAEIERTARANAVAKRKLASNETVDTPEPSSI